MCSADTHQKKHRMQTKFGFHHENTIYKWAGFLDSPFVSSPR